MAHAWYATREDVKSALDYKETANNNAQIDRAIDSASRAIESLTHRKFYPEIDTRYFDWPNYQYARSWRLWLEGNEVTSVTSLTSGGVVIDPSDYFLEPNTYGPPFNRIEMDLSTSGAFSAGSTHQRSIAVEGVFGYSNDTENATTLSASGSDSIATLSVTSGNAIGVGQILQIEDEYLIVTEKLWVDTTQNLQTPLTGAKNDTTVSVSTGSAFAAGDVLLIDSEKVRVNDVAGNSLFVTRAWDGSVLASHTGSDIYATWTLKVQRGALGSTAASHATSVAVDKILFPGLIRELCVGEAVNSLLQESSGYSRAEAQESNNAGEVGRGIQGLRDQVKAGYARKARIRGV